MWFVAQVLARHESQLLDKITKLVDEQAYKECFIPMAVMKKKYSGEWKYCKEIVFPGYIFIKTRTPDFFHDQLIAHKIHARMLCSENEQGEKIFIPISEEEKALIKSISNEKYITEMSEGIIEGDKVVITKGPLKDCISYVKKIDRHKKLAYLEFEILGRTVRVKLGLEILKKS